MTPDTWSASDAYELYMGRWSRKLARDFIGWLEPAPRAHWLEVGCGTGALTSTIAGACDPASIVASDPSASFVEHLRSSMPAARTSYVTAAASSLPTRDGGFDVIVSGLVLNFVPEPEAALIAMRERARRGGTIAAYVWDYAGGVELLQRFWEEAVALDPKAAELDEAERFAAWTSERLAGLFRAAQLEGIATSTLDVVTELASFDDYWKPFLGRTGPAPSYVAGLDAAQRGALAERLKKRLVPSGDGAFALKARAFAVRGVA